MSITRHKLFICDKGVFLPLFNAQGTAWQTRIGRIAPLFDVGIAEPYIHPYVPLRLEDRYEYKPSSLEHLRTLAQLQIDTLQSREVEKRRRRTGREQVAKSLYDTKQSRVP